LGEEKRYAEGAEGAKIAEWERRGKKKTPSDRGDAATSPGGPGEEKK
jgi:hypothetical protein